MPIPRDEIIETLDALAAPLGPQTSHDERLARQDRWVDEGGVELLEALLGVVASPPPEEQLQYASLDDWNTLLVEVAGALGKRYPTWRCSGSCPCSTMTMRGPPPSTSSAASVMRVPYLASVS